MPRAATLRTACSVQRYRHARHPRRVADARPHVTSPLRRRAFRFVLTVGILSLFADVVYEGAHAVNGQYLALLGASGAAVGAVAGLGELAAYGLRFLSGRWADATRAYWPITILGYCVNLLAVPLLAVAGHWLVAAAFMLLERAGKAIRNPARDALFSHAAKAVGVGWAWGIHEALDETGAALGPAVVAGVLWLRGGLAGYRLAYALLLVPGLVSIAILLWGRRFSPRPEELEPPEARGSSQSGFGAAFWLLTAAAALTGAGFADFSLIAFHLSRTGVLAAAAVPLLYGMANLVNAGGALGLGRAFDKVGPWLLAAGVLVPLAATPLAFASRPSLVVAGIVLWGVSVTVQQTLFKAMLTRLVPSRRRAWGFGLFDGSWGVASFLGGLALGALYDRGAGDLVGGALVLLGAAVPLAWLAVGRAARERQ